MKLSPTWRTVAAWSEDTRTLWTEALRHGFHNLPILVREINAGWMLNYPLKSLASHSHLRLEGVAGTVTGSLSEMLSDLPKIIQLGRR